MQQVLEQVYEAFNGESRILAIIGARTLLDMLLVSEVGDTGSFASKLQAFETKGGITKADRIALEAAIEAGNAAAHRGHDPAERDSIAVFDIVEHALEAKYHRVPAVAGLQQRTPKR
jgi:hypothetical protein